MFSTSTAKRVAREAEKIVSCWAEQRALLEAEGVTFRKNGCVDMKKCRRSKRSWTEILIRRSETHET